MHSVDLAALRHRYRQLLIQDRYVGQSDAINWFLLIIADYFEILHVFKLLKASHRADVWVETFHVF